MSTIVAVGQCSDAVGVVMTSSDDGATWTQQVSPLDHGLMRDVVWDGTVFVAVGAGPGSTMIQTSPDGVAWTARATPFDAGFSRLQAVAASPATIVAIGFDRADTNGLLVSADHGVTWTNHPLPYQSGTGFSSQHDVHYANGLFVLTGSDTFGPGPYYHVWTSTDGIAWSGASDPSAPSGRAAFVSYEHGLWVVADNAGHVWTSPDAVIWTLFAWTATTATWLSSASLWVTQQATTGARALSTPDFSATAGSVAGGSAGGTYIGDGISTGTCVLLGSSDCTTNTILKTTDGATWTWVPSPMDLSSSANNGVAGFAMSGAAPAPRALWHYGGVHSSPPSRSPWDVGRRRGT